MKISVISGGFDPIHSGHIAYINEAKKLGDKLIVLLNSDDWIINKKDKFFMPFSERKDILENIRSVDTVLSFEDDSIGSCIKGLEEIKNLYPDDEIIFCNGGDRNQKNIPEMSIDNISFKFSIGGDNKKNSSSWILKNWSYPSEKRIWGNFYNLFQDDNVKVKELIVDSGKGMSFQRHEKRNEFWLVTKGSCKVMYSNSSPEEASEIILNKHDSLFILKNEWHQIINENDSKCHIVEIQYGEETIEEDIERLFNYESS